MNATVTAVCKSLRACGLSKRDEHRIENHLTSILTSSGPEFLLSRLSELKDWRKMHMKGDTLYHPEWHQYSVRYGSHAVPTSPLESTLWHYKDKSFFAIIGAITKAVELSVPTEKQLKKWLKGVRCENNSSNEPAFTVQCSRRAMAQLEQRLVSKWSHRDFFDYKDVTGTNIPGSGVFTKIRFDKNTGKAIPSSVAGAHLFSMDTCPLFVWQFLHDVSDMVPLGMHTDNPQVFSETFRELVEDYLHNPVLQEEAEGGTNLFDPEQILYGTKVLSPKFGFMHPVGNIGFLQQGAGKLRTVANPNRMVQYANVPLGEVLSDFTYQLQGCYVRNQEAGMRWAQSQLNAGESLSSFDMTSATDTLDYQKFLHEYFRDAYETEDYPLLRRSLELFEDTSGAPWCMNGLVQDLLGAGSPYMSWTVGQPLGLRPSFPVLSLMNSLMAVEASRLVDGKRSYDCFACVGDDLIIKTRYAEAYMDLVRRFNGIINNDKSLESDRYAEFCSHLVTKSAIYPLKPRWAEPYDSSPGNVEKFTTTGLRPRVKGWVKELHDDIAAYSLDGFHHAGYSNTPVPKPLDERIGVNTMLTVLQTAPPAQDGLSLQSFYLECMRDGKDGLLRQRIYDLASSSASRAYSAFSTEDTGRMSIDTLIRRAEITCDLGEFMSRYGSILSTSVELPVMTEYDYRSDRRVPKRSELVSAKAQLRELEKVSVVRVGDLLSAEYELKQRLFEDKKPMKVELVMEMRPDGEAVITWSHNDDKLTLDASGLVQEILSEYLYDPSTVSIPHTRDQYCLDDDDAR